mgnify:FL=1
MVVTNVEEVGDVGGEVREIEMARAAAAEREGCHVERARRHLGRAERPQPHALPAAREPDLRHPPPPRAEAHSREPRVRTSRNRAARRSST